MTATMTTLTNNRGRLMDAIVLVEDRHFFNHHGIDVVAMIRALLVNIRERRYAQGGSTITQQLARMLYLTPKKTLWRKIREILIALWLDLRFSKFYILNQYMRWVYMGQYPDGSPIRGFAGAAKFYFNKTLADTSLAEQATLVAMLRGPNLYRPNTIAGLARRVTVLNTMLEANLISSHEFAFAMIETLSVVSKEEGEL